VTVRPVVIFGDPTLHRPTRPVTAFDGDLAQLVEDLFETMSAANGVGLAANQIGVGERVFVYDCPTHRGDPGPNHRGVIVNPVLTVAPRRDWETADEPEDEGCLSVPGESFALLRSPWAKVRGQDRTGRALTVAGTDLFARCLQHEIDHLDGFVYLDRLARRENRQARKAVRDHGWGGPGLAWMPGIDRDPFGHDDVDPEDDHPEDDDTVEEARADSAQDGSGPDGLHVDATAPV
jgi:peptide deformylase